MAPRQVSPMVLLLLLSTVGGFLPAVAVLMLGPVLVALGREFQTSVPLTGQYAAATARTWGVTAPLAGPVADAYMRRLMLLMGLLLLAVGLLGSALAWHYGALLALRLLTGVGAALVAPTSIAMLADVFPPAGRAKAIGWVISAYGVGAAVGMPLVAGLVEAGGWRLSFSVLGTVSLGACILVWVWCPRSLGQPGQALAFFSHYREVGAHVTFWYVLAANALQQMVFFGLFAYLAAYLIQTYHMPAGDTALPLALAGGGHCRGRRPGGVGRGPSPPISVVRHIVRGEWGAGGASLHHTDVAMGNSGAGLWGGQSRARLLHDDADVAARVRGPIAGHHHRVVSRERPTWWVRRPSAWRTDAYAGRVPEGGPLLSGGGNPRQRGDPVQNTKLGRIPYADGSMAGYNSHQIRRHGRVPYTG